jgi:hypothetical protein
MVLPVASLVKPLCRPVAGPKQNPAAHELGNTYDLDGQPLALADLHNISIFVAIWEIVIQL